MFWKVIVALAVFMFTANYLHHRLSSRGHKVLLVQSKTFLINDENIVDIDSNILKVDSAMDIMHRKMRYMYKTTKRPVTKFPKLIENRFNGEKIKKMTSRDFEENIKKYADNKNRIILAVVDEEYLHFAINFYKLSIQRHNLTNFMFITLDQAATDYCKAQNIPHNAFPLATFLKKSTQISNFGSRGFSYKTNMKTAVMIQALQTGVHVLMVDVDVIFFKNPLPFLHCNNCSLLLQQDRELYNSGFVYAINSNYAKQVYHVSWSFFLKLQKSHDQSYFNMAIEYLQKKKSLFELQVLPKAQFPCGVYYFEHVHRPFENLPTCPDCVLVHNNYIGSRDAKLYRLKENHMWVVDEESYYSNHTAKYLTYENPFEFEKTLEMEVEALKSAMVLAAKLDRILILPSFHCCSCAPIKQCSHSMYRCSLLSVLRVSSFEWTFEGKYREHSFLKHPIVPANVIKSTSPLLLVNETVYFNKEINSSKLHIYASANSTTNPNLDDVSNWVEKYDDYSVIQFHSLYNTKFHERIAEKDYKLQHLLYLMKNAFECTEYEQWEKNVLKFR